MGAGCAALLELAPASAKGAAETAKDSVVSLPLLDFDGSCSSPVWICVEAGGAALLELASASTKGAAAAAKDSAVSFLLLGFDGSCSSTCVDRLPPLPLVFCLAAGLGGTGSPV